MHTDGLRNRGESDERLDAVAVWRGTPYFTEASQDYDEKALSALLIMIAQINVWNRLNIATKQVTARAGLGAGGRSSVLTPGPGDGPARTPRADGRP